MLAAPEQFAVKYETRHAEYPNRLGGTADAVQLCTPRARRIIREPRRIGAGFRQHPADHADILDVELALPEAFEDRVVIAAEDCLTLALRVHHAAEGERRIPDLLRAADDEIPFAGLPAAIHAAVAHPAPLMGVALLLRDMAAVVDPGGAEKARDVQAVRQPIDAHRK